MAYEIKNPVISGFSPDPSILRVEDDYYIATSTFHWNSGIQIFHSKDLANWNLLTHVLDEDSNIDLRGTDTPAGIWAPDLSYDDQTGLFWITLSKMNNMAGRMFDTDNYTMFSESINGPWSSPIYLNSIGFDPSMFHDDDGHHYVTTLEWETRQGFEQPGSIVLEEFDPDKRSLIGKTIRISKGGTDRGCVEAPHLYKHNGWYYLMTAEGGTGYGHGVVIQRSRMIEGPYETYLKNPIITSTPYYYFRRNDPDATRLDLYNPRTDLQKSGHGSLVNTPNGEWYIAHLCARPLPGTLNSTLGRETAIQKVEWTDDDWLQMADGSNLAKTNVPGIKNVIPNVENRDSGMNDDFENNSLDVHLLSPYSFQNDSWLDLTANSGWLRMKGRQSFFSKFEPSILAARVDSFKLEAETKMKFTPQHFSESAGLVAYYDNNNWLFGRVSFCEEQNGSVIDIIQAKTGEKKELISVKIPLNNSEIKLKLKIDYDYVQFYYSQTNDWLTLGDKIDIKYMSDEAIDGFTGLMVGIGAWDAYRRESFVDFDYFKTNSL